MEMEYFARNVFGDRYFGSASWTQMSVWKKFYIDCLKLTQRSFVASVGSIDDFHRNHILETFRITIERIQKASRKDAIHTALILGLFQLVFLLLGNVPRRMALGKRKLPSTIGFSAFRTLSYCQTEEQLGYLLRSRVENHPEEFGFGDFFDAQMAFFHWEKEQKKSHARATYVEWVRQTFPDLYARMR